MCPGMSLSFIEGRRGVSFVSILLVVAVTLISALPPLDPEKWHCGDHAVEGTSGIIYAFWCFPADVASDNEKMKKACRGIHEIDRSTQRLRALMPKVNITVFTNVVDFDFQATPAFSIHLLSPSFMSEDLLGKQKKEWFLRRIKLYAICHSPYKYTLYLDGDTFVLRNIDHMFGWFLHRRFRHYDLFLASVANVEEGSPIYNFNSGVLLLNLRSAHVHEFLTRWIHQYLERQFPMDQLSLHLALIETPSLSFAILPPHYNLRGHISQEIQGHVVIYHYRHIRMSIVDQINSTKKRRRIHSHKGVLLIDNEGIEQPLFNHESSEDH